MVAAIGISFGVGMIVGYFFYKLFGTPIKAGELFFYDGESGEPPTMAAGLDMSIEDVCKQDYVAFKVNSRR